MSACVNFVCSPTHTGQRFFAGSRRASATSIVTNKLLKHTFLLAPRAVSVIRPPDQQNWRASTTGNHTPANQEHLTLTSHQIRSIFEHSRLVVRLHGHTWYDPSCKETYLLTPLTPCDHGAQEACKLAARLSPGLPLLALSTCPFWKKMPGIHRTEPQNNSSALANTLLATGAACLLAVKLMETDQGSNDDDLRRIKVSEMLIHDVIHSHAGRIL